MALSRRLRSGFTTSGTAENTPAEILMVGIVIAQGTRFESTDESSRLRDKIYSANSGFAGG